MLRKTLSGLIATALFVLVSTAAQAVSTTPFNPYFLSAGDSTLGSISADAGEDFSSATLQAKAVTDLIVEVSYVINPYFLDLSGAPLNPITLAYSIDYGASEALTVTPVYIGTGTIGAGSAVFTLNAGEVAYFFVDGVAGTSGNQVVFELITRAIPPTTPVPLPASGLLLVAGLGVMALRRRKPA